MTRHKSRVARRSRHRARRGTRKQSGGMFGWLAGLFGPKPAGGAETAAPAAVAVAQNHVTALPEQGGGRKTRHRRRRSPRRHRK